MQLLRPSLEGFKQVLHLSLILIVRRISFRRRVDHQVNNDLPSDVRTQTDGKQLIDLLDHDRVDVDQLHVTSAPSALSDHPLGDRVIRDQLDVALHVRHNFAERCERNVPIYIRLVNFICQYHKIVALTKLHDLANICLRKALPSGISRVNHRKCPDVCALIPSLPQRPIKLRNIQSPPLRFVQVVPHRSPAVQRDGGSVQRVLRDGYHDAIKLVLHKTHDRDVDPLACAVSEKDVISVRRDSISLRNELGYILPDVP
mmetsp:Transcript_47494/g.148597  ORF Transcript_47494/g.148597 Transcript_47494/m.148597 type:complete len:258 (-) Transcript_47494:591-1364(-)